MIQLDLKDAVLVEGLHPLFPKAFDYLRHADFQKMEDGKHEIDGENLFLSVQTFDGKGDDAPMEYHQAYIDIQMCIEGVEQMGWKPTSGLVEQISPYDAEKDIVTVSGTVPAKREKLPVIVRMYKKGGSGKFSELVRAEEVLTGENGAVSYSFKMGENDEKGRYVVLINCPFEKQIVKEIQYTTLEEINDSLKRIDSASLSALPSVFEAERDTLNLIEPEFDALQSKDFIYHCIFNGKTYADKDAGIFKNIYRQALRISNLIEGETGTAVEDIKNNHNNGYWKISENKETSTFKAFTETFDEKQQAGVLGKLKKSTGFDNNDTVFNTAVIAEDIKAQTTYNTMLAVMEKYSDTVNVDYKKFKALSTAGKENVWKAFTKEIDSFIDTDKIKQSIEAAAEAEYKKENSGSGNGGNGGNGGNNGSSGNKSSGVDLYPGVIQTDKPTPDWYIDSNASNTTNTVFSDIENIEWAKYSINKLYSLGAISGKSEGIFAPNDNMTREELCKIIASAFKLEHAENSQNVTFNDVEASAWYADYVAICTENGIINGIGDNLFGVGKTVTREEIATILVRAAEAAGKSLDYDYTIFPFPDDDEISDWAHDSVKILRECMIINGMEDDRFAPKENVTRAQGAKMIVGVLEFSY